MKNPEDPEEVNWAMATKLRPDSDIIVTPDLPGMPIDPSVGDNGLVAKLGIDVTKPARGRKRFEKIDFPEEIKERISNIMKKQKY